MAGKKIEPVDLDQYILDMEKDEIITKLKIHTPPKRGDIPLLFRTMAMNEKEFLWVKEERTLTHFWYNLAKPVLSRLDWIDPNKLTKEIIDSWRNKISYEIGVLVDAGYLLYDDLRIVDTSRKRMTAGGYYHCPDAVFPNLILCTEKDSTYPSLERIARMIGCNSICGGGNSAKSAIEGLLFDMQNDIDEDEPITIFSFTDYDPAGYYIAENFKKQIKASAPRLGLQIEVNAKRLALFPYQITDDQIRKSRFLLTAKGKGRKTILKNWMRETGGINNERYGLELESIGDPRDIAVMFYRTIEDEIDLSPCKEFIPVEYAREVLEEELRNIFSKFINGCAWDEGKKITVKDFEILDLIKEGHYNYPIDELCEKKRNSVLKKKIRKYISSLNFYKP